MNELLIKLHKILDERFNEDDLRDLCFNLGVKYDDLPREGAKNKARELIADLERRRQITDLICAGKEMRPDIDWDEPVRVPRGGVPERTAGSGKTNTVIFYTPTIVANSFFAAILEYVVDRAKGTSINLIIEKGEPGVGFHEAGNFTHVIRKYGTSDYVNPVLIMVPPKPESFEKIWAIQEDIKLNLITLDMPINDSDIRRFEACEFHKKIIIVDNREGAKLAAEEVISFCKRNAIDAINVLICEGDIHNRGRLFEEVLNRKKDNAGIEVNYLSELQELSFSDAVKKANQHVYKTLSRAQLDLNTRETFIFCANDNMAIGARMGISNIDPTDFAQYKDIRIVCFDASTFVKVHIDMNDRFLWRAVDQRYWEIVNKALETAETLFRGETVVKEIVRIKPVIYR
jgi:DNA-binding LacI/PurR family transcriptional regulator